MAESKPAQILDLDALAPERPRVKLPGGDLYELTVPSDLGIVALKSIEKFSNEVGELQGKEEELTEDEVAMLSDALNRLARLLIRDAPPAKIDALDDYQKIALASNFQKMLPDSKGDDANATPLSTSGS